MSTRVLMVTSALLLLSVAAVAADDASLEERVGTLEAALDQGGGMSAGDLRIHWNDGLQIDMPRQNAKVRIGGRIHNDWIFYSADEDLDQAVGGLEDGVSFRRARIHIAGEFGTNYEFKAMFDLAQHIAYKDIYIGVKRLPGIGAVRVGKVREPFCLDRYTDCDYITFIERGLPAIFAYERNIGVRVHNAVLDQRIAYAAGLFRETHQGHGEGDGEYAFTGRLAGLPIWLDDGRRLVHLGVAYSYRSVEQSSWAQTPEAYSAPDFVRTGAIQSDSESILGLEAACVLGPLSFQGEYVQASVARDYGSDVHFAGCYAYVSYFLTGENRAYDKRKGAFDRLRPTTEFLGRDKGFGAWEAALRYSYIDLNSHDIRGGELADWSLGLNWYLTANMRIMTNYIYADADLQTADDVAHVWLTRFQFSF